MSKISPVEIRDFLNEFNYDSSKRKLQGKSEIVSLQHTLIDWAGRTKNLEAAKTITMYLVNRPEYASNVKIDDYKDNIQALNDIFSKSYGKEDTNSSRIVR